jgi:hypothetical protein
MLLTERLCLYASSINLSFVTFPSSQFMFYVFMFVFYCSSYVCFHVLYVLPYILCALCFCIVLCICLLMYIVVLFLTICVHVYGLLPPGDKTIAVNKYHNHNHILYSLNTNCPLRTLIYKSGLVIRLSVDSMAAPGNCQNLLLNF